MSSLERSYRRLLALYPDEHRVTYEDEMLGVLLASAGPGQRRPHWRDAVDLARGALAVRLRRSASDERWQGAAAIVSVVAPILLCLGIVATAVTGTVLFVAWPLCIGLGLAGWRRTAAGTAWLGCLMLAATAPAVWPGWFFLFGPWFGLAVLAAAALTWSAGLPRGIELLGRSRLIALVSGVGMLGLAEINEFNYGMRYLSEGTFDGAWAAAQTWLFLAFGLVLVAGGALRRSTPAHRRAALLLVVPVTAIAWRSFLDVLPVGSGYTFHAATETALGIALTITAFCGFVAVTLAAERRESHRNARIASPSS